MKQFDRDSARLFISDTYKDSEKRQLEAVRDYYKNQITELGKQKVQEWFCEKLEELLKLKTGY